MDWYRMKTVLIILFLGINLFLAALLGYESYSEHKVDQVKTEAILQTLERGGIKVEARLRPSSPRLRALRLENPYADSFAFAARVLGDGAHHQENTFEKDGNKLSFTENGFIFEAASPAVPPQKKHITSLKSALEAMGLSMRYATGKTENNAVIFTQKVDGVPLFGAQLRVMPCADGSVSRIQGTWANIADIYGEKSRVVLPAQALLTFLQEGTHEGETITDATCGYSVLLSDGAYRTADAVPAWRIETESGTVFFYDARQ